MDATELMPFKHHQTSGKSRDGSPKEASHLHVEDTVMQLETLNPDETRRKGVKSSPTLSSTGQDTRRRSRQQDALTVSSPASASTSSASNPFQFKYKYDRNFPAFKIYNFYSTKLHVDVSAGQAGERALFSTLTRQISHLPDPTHMTRKFKEKKLSGDQYMEVQVKHLQSHVKALADSAPIVPLRHLKQDDTMEIDNPEAEEHLKPNFTNKTMIENLSKGILHEMTLDLVTVYRTSDPTYRYDEGRNPKRVLTKPNKGVHNHGHDNDNHDYILYVNDLFGNEEGRKFVILDLLGHGTFGQVAKCMNLKTREIVAIKIIKNQSAYFNQSMMEVTILEMLNHKYDSKDLCHLTRMKDTFIYKKHLCIVFELLSLNLFELIKQNHFKGFNHSLIRVFLAQILDALQLLNEAKIIHCDLKPENILLKRMDSPEIKVIDFGSACHEQHTVYTYIQSRFYRAPEILLGLPYQSAIDSWSLGCIAAELYLGLPLFPGHSNYDQIFKMVQCLDLPPNHMMEKGKTASLYFEKVYIASPQLSSDPMSTVNQEAGPSRPYYFKLRARTKNEKPSKKYFAQTSLEDIIMQYRPGVHYHANQQQHAALFETPVILDEEEKRQRACLLDFLRGLLKYNPLERWTPQQAKKHPYISGDIWRDLPFQPPGTTLPAPRKTDFRQGGDHPTRNIKGNERMPPLVSQVSNFDPSPTIPNYSTNNRQRALSINSPQWMPMPPHIQRLAAHHGPPSIHHPSLLMPDSYLYSTASHPSLPTANNTLGNIYTNTHVGGASGFNTTGSSGGGMTPWFAAPPGGASQHIMDYRRDYLFSAAANNTINGPTISAPMSTATTTDHTNNYSALSGSMPLYGTGWPTPNIISIIPDSLNHPPYSHASLFGLQDGVTNFSLPTTTLNNNNNFQGSNMPTNSGGANYRSRRFSQQTLPILFDEEHPLHATCNQSLASFSDSTLSNMDQQANGLAMLHNFESQQQQQQQYQGIQSTQRLAPLSSYYVSGGGLHALTHSIQQRRISNPPTMPSSHHINLNNLSYNTNMPQAKSPTAEQNKETSATQTNNPS